MNADPALGKRNAARRALEEVRDGMTLGIGTGSTANEFIDALGEKIREGWRLQGVPTSKASEARALDVGVEIIVPDETTRIDLAVDGADEVDPEFNLIKGGGGALLREKIVAAAADRFVVLVDEGKHVGALGRFALPVEVEPFGWALSVQALRDVLSKEGFAGAPVVLRAARGEPTLSDGGHLLFDCALERIEAPARLDAALRAIPGVIETGLFCGLVDAVITGETDGARYQRSQS